MVTYIGEEIERDESGNERIVRRITVAEFYGNDIEAMTRDRFTEDALELSVAVMGG